MRLHGGPGAEQGGPHPYHGGALGDGVLKVSAHAHRQTNDIILIIRHLFPDVNKKLTHCRKIWLVGPGLGGDRGDGHQTPQADGAHVHGLTGQGLHLLGHAAPLALLLADVHLQQDILDQTLLVRLVLDGLEQMGRAHRLDEIHVAARFNEFITSKLLSGAMDGLLRHEVREEDIHVAWVPGAFEIPVIAARMARSGKYDAVICLGAVIRGSTSHYDYVCNEVSKGVASVSLETGVPVMFGVLTTENIEQAIERAGTKAGNKGYDCALGAVEMVNLIREIDA